MKVKTELKLMYIRRILSYPPFTHFHYNEKRISRLEAIREGMKEIDKFFDFNNNDTQGR